MGGGASKEWGGDKSSGKEGKGKNSGVCVQNKERVLKKRTSLRGRAVHSGAGGFILTGEPQHTFLTG